jgi:mono/diheme cytochrome c family protein
MSNHHFAARSLVSILLVSLPCSVIVVGCDRGNREAGPTKRNEDSTLSADSTGKVAESVPLRTLSYEEMQGSDLYGKYCQVCHGQEGKGDGFNAFNLDPHPRDFTDSAYMKALSDDQIVQTIAGGGRSVNKSPLMPAYGWTLNRQQIRYLASYVRSFRGGPVP